MAGAVAGAVAVVVAVAEAVTVAKLPGVDTTVAAGEILFIDCRTK